MPTVGTATLSSRDKSRTRNRRRSSPMHPLQICTFARQTAGQCKRLFARCQRTLQIHDFPFELSYETLSGKLTACKIDLVGQGPSCSAEVHPPDGAIAEKHRHSVVAEFPACGWDVGFESVGPPHQVREARSVPNEGIERREEPDPVWILSLPLRSQLCGPHVLHVIQNTQLKVAVREELRKKTFTIPYYSGRTPQLVVG